MSAKTTGRVLSVHALIQVKCSRCEGTCSRLGLANVTTDGTIAVNGTVCGKDAPLCNECVGADLDRENAEYHKAIEQRRWAKQVARMKPIKPGGKRA